jgi:signal transduction histidine kinase
MKDERQVWVRAELGHSAYLRVLRLYAPLVCALVLVMAALFAPGRVNALLLPAAAIASAAGAAYALISLVLPAAAALGLSLATDAVLLAVAVVQLPREPFAVFCNLWILVVCALVLGPRALLALAAVFAALLAVLPVVDSTLDPYPLAATGPVSLLAVGVLLAVLRRRVLAGRTELVIGSHAAERMLLAQARAVEELREGLLSSVSHEMRTPLTSIVGFARTLNDKLDHLPRERVREMLAAQLVEAERLERLLRDLLDVDRLRRGVIDPHRSDVDVAELLARVVASFPDQASRIVVEAERVRAKVDTAQLERIVEHLIGNARKYAPASTLWVRARREDGGVLLEVEDDGPGIPDELKRRVFEPFVRENRYHRHAPGTGVGLSLVERFAALHGGRAWVEDRCGGGSLFKVLLPDTAEEAAPPVPALDSCDGADPEAGEDVSGEQGL